MGHRTGARCAARRARRRTGARARPASVGIVRPWPRPSPSPPSRARSTLLLQLVTGHQLDIFDIPLADVVDAFVAEVADAGPRSTSPSCPSSWWSAAVLIELKSQRLLPGSGEVEPDEELVGWEERDLLLARLLECQAYAAAADGFALLIEQAARSVPRTAGLDPDLVVHAPDLLEGVTPDELAAGLHAGHRPSARPPWSTSHHVTVDTVTVSDAVAELALRLPRSGPATVPGADRPPDLPHRDHRPLPGPARAVQAGEGLPRPGPRPSATCRSRGWPPTSWPA